jgi:hypothetical protein
MRKTVAPLEPPAAVGSRHSCDVMFARPRAKKAIQEICNADDRDHAEAAIKTFAQLYGATFPKACASGDGRL